MSKVPITQLPLAPNPLQQTLTQLQLQPQPSSQRRSTTFKSTTQGVWARTYPLWTAWPLRVTKEEVEAMGVDLSAGGQVNVEDVLRRWDPVNVVSEGENGLNVMTSQHRSLPRPELLGVSASAIEASLPHLAVGDAVEVCNSGAEASESKAREDLLNILSGRQVLVSKEQGEDGPVYGPWSTRYVGHQFGSWAGQLGDGRAISLIETATPDGGRMEIQLKGAGRTPFSRTADGLAVLRSSVREFLGCEAVAALGISSTRSLALLTLPIEDLPVMRENGAEPSSLMARLAPTFIRIGHFEAMNPDQQARRMTQIYLGGGWLKEEDEGETEGPLGGQGNLEGLRDLAEFCKDVMGFKEKPTLEWVKEVVRRNAEMVAGWQVYGWMHGVLNTDNISILGTTIDYGPYAFMDIFDEGHICNHSDPTGLYSYRRQPERVLFALDKLVSALSPLIGYEATHGAASSGWSEGKTKDDVKEWNGKAEEVTKDWQDGFWATERETERIGWAKRFGLNTTQSTDDRDIKSGFLTLLHAHSMDFHASFRILSTFDPSKIDEPKYTRIFAANMVADTTINRPADSVDQAINETQHWLDLYAQRVSQPEEVDARGESWTEKRKETMLGANPRFVLRQWVLEELIADLEKAGTENIQEARRKLARVLDVSLILWSS